MVIKSAIFNTQMVEAILQGRKTSTRRVVKPQPVLKDNFWELGGAEWSDNIRKFHPMPGHTLYNRMPYHKDDIMYVRETFYEWTDGYVYKAWVSPFAQPGSCQKQYEKWKPAIHMPRSAARIWLKVKDVYIECLQEITDAEAENEGCGYIQPNKYGVGTKSAFMELWDSLIPKKDLSTKSSLADPWVWVVEFERCDRPDNWDEYCSKI